MTDDPQAVEAAAPAPEGAAPAPAKRKPRRKAAAPVELAAPVEPAAPELVSEVPAAPASRKPRRKAAAPVEPAAPELASEAPAASASRKPRRKAAVAEPAAAEAPAAPAAEVLPAAPKRKPRRKPAAAQDPIAAEAPAAPAPSAGARRGWLAGLARLGGRLRRPRLTIGRPIIVGAAACLLVAALAGGALLYRARRAAPAAPAAATLTGALLIDAAATAQVGDSVTVTVGPAAAADGLPATLTMIGSYGPRVYRAAFAGGTARFLIPGDDTRESGAATLVAAAGAARGAATITLEPGAPVEPITPLVGPRSITADARHWSTVVAVPFDRFGNPIAEGTPVDVRALHPSDQLELQHTHVRNLLAWARIYSRTDAGRTSVSVTAAGKYGPEATFMEVPNWPARFGVTASPTDVPADGRQFVTLRTDVIRDRFNNVMLDGTLVTFIVEAPGAEPRIIPSYTVDGIAKAQLQAPRAPGRLTVRAEVYNSESRPLEIAFAAGPAVNDFAIVSRVDAPKQSIELTAGPMLGAQQQFIPDGTPVQFVLTDSAGRQTRIDAVSERGYAWAVARLAFLQIGKYTAEVTVGTGYGKSVFQVP